MITLGLDVHVRNSYLEARDDSGKRLLRGRCGNTLGELAQKLGVLEQQGQAVHAVLESTTNSRAMALLLRHWAEGAGLELAAQVLDARKLRVIAESVDKCDRVDAATLCELAQSKLKLPACYVPDDEVFALREHLRSRHDLVRLRTMLKNRVHSVLHRRGILRPAGDLFSGMGRGWLSEVELDEAGRTLIDAYLQHVDALEATIKASTRRLEQLAKTDRWLQGAALLRSMPGVGLITALTVLAEAGDWSRFKGRAAVAHYAGLTPIMRDSNDKRWRGGISRRGPAHLRAAIVEAAWTSIRHVPAYEQMYDRISGRRGKQVAIVAVARRMLEDMFTMMSKNQAFRYSDGDRQGRAERAG